MATVRAVAIDERPMPAIVIAIGGVRTEIVLRMGSGDAGAG